MKIGFFIDVNFDRGGAPISTKLIANGVGQDVTFDCYIVKPKLSTDNELTCDNYKIISINEFDDMFPFMLFHPFKWLKLCFLIKIVLDKEKFDVIHANMPFSGMAIGFLKMLGLVKHGKLIYTDREHVADMKLYHRIRYKIFIANQYDKVVTISNKSRYYWNTIIKKKKTQTIYNTSNYIFESCTNNNLIINRYLNVIFVGRMAKNKNWDLAVDIVKLCHNINFTFVISYFNSEQKKQTDRIINELKEFKNVHFEFNLTQKEIKNQFEKSDIFVFTSVVEAFGRTGVEAMSQKNVVIGTNVGGIPEVIQKKENILNFDAKEFAKRLKYYDSNRDKLIADKKWFYKRYVDNFSIEKNIQEHIKLYNEVVHNESR